MYGLETTVLLPLHAEVASWCEPVFYPADLQQALNAQTAMSVLVTSPLQLRAMLEMTGAARLPGMVISATAPLDRQLAALAETRWGTQVLEIFGADGGGLRREQADRDGRCVAGLSGRGADGRGWAVGFRRICADAAIERCGGAAGWRGAVSVGGAARRHGEVGRPAGVIGGIIARADGYRGRFRRRFRGAGRSGNPPNRQAYGAGGFGRAERR